MPNIKNTLYTRWRPSIHIVEPSDLTSIGQQQMRLRANIGRETQIKQGLQSRDPKVRENAMKDRQQDIARKATQRIKQKNKLIRHLDEASSYVTKDELRLINGISAIAAASDANREYQVTLPVNHPQYLNSEFAANLARARQNLLLESYMTNPNGHLMYWLINPYSPEGQDRLSFASSNATLSILRSAATGASTGLLGSLYSTVGPYATVFSIGEGALGDYLGRKGVSYFTDNPYWKAAGGALGGALGMYHNVGVTLRALETAMKFSAVQSPLLLKQFKPYMRQNIPYILGLTKEVKPYYKDLFLNQPLGVYKGFADNELGNGNLVNTYVYGEKPLSLAIQVPPYTLSERMTLAILKRYPNREIPVYLTSLPEYLEEVPHLPENTKIKTITVSADHDFTVLNNPDLNVGGHLIDIVVNPDGKPYITSDGNPIIRSVDLWKFYPKDYMPRWSIKGLLSKFGLDFVDKTGTPFVLQQPFHETTKLDLLNILREYRTDTPSTPDALSRFVDEGY